MKFPLIPLTFLVLLMVCCNCDSGHPTPDTDVNDSDRNDSDQDRTSDADPETNDADPDEADADPDDADRPDDGTISELCGEEGPAWSWHPFECPELDPPADCCSSCIRLTCRELSGMPEMWEDLVAYQTRGSVGLVNLTKGTDVLIFPGFRKGDEGYTYFTSSIGSEYVTASKIFWKNDTIDFTQIVARHHSKTDSPEILVDDTPQSDVWSTDVYGSWVVWRRTPDATKIFEIVLKNIETEEFRVLDDESEIGVDLYAVSIWGDRVVWSDSRGRLKEHRISTSTTREVLTDMGFTMSSVSVWENYAVFTQTTSHPWQVYLVDLDTSDVRRVSPSTSEQESSFLHGGRVVWSDYRGSTGGPAGMHVYVYSIENDREYVLNESARGGTNPKIFDRTIIWNGGPEPEGLWVTRIADI